MSRIGKQPIPIPPGVTIAVENGMVNIAGPKGALKRVLHKEIQAQLEQGTLVLLPALQSKRTAALWGLERAIVANMVHGVAQGYEKRLEIEGVGYRVQAQGDKQLTLTLGFSHPVIFNAPEGVSFKVEKNTITVSGIDKGLVGQVAANIRAKKPPEPYKGKGIHYAGEIIRRKAGKKATAAAK